MLYTMACCLCCCVATLLFLPLTSAGSKAKMLSDLIENLLSEEKGYNPRIRPGLDSGRPLIVSVNMFVQEISSVSEVNMEFSMTAYLRQSWRDDRLSYTHTSYNTSITLNYNQFKNIWAPDLFIRNLKRGMFHDITVPNRLIRLSPEGTILYSQRVSLTMSCDMELHKYPMDNQTCKIDFGSYGYTTDELILRWKAVKEPVEINKDIILAKFKLLGVNAILCDANFNTTGSYPCLNAFFHLERRLKSYFLHNYLPSLLVVLLAWMSFWIDLGAVPARISLGILTILTISTQSGAVNRNMPSVSLTKAIDVWMASCLVFVFASFIEYAIVNVLARRHKRLKLKEIERAMRYPNVNPVNPYGNTHGSASVYNGKSSARYRLAPVSPNKEADDASHAQEDTTLCDVEPQDPTFDEPETLFMWWTKVQKNKALMVDVISRVMFPILFLGFNLMYWPFYFY